MEDRARPQQLAWEPGADGRAAFAGRHHGFDVLDPPAIHERRLEFDGPAGTLVLHDTVRTEGEHDLEWTFPLAPGAVPQLTETGVLVELGAARLTIAGAGLAFAVEDGWFAPVYGARERAPCVRARRRGRRGEDRQVIELRAGRG